MSPPWEERIRAAEAHLVADMAVAGVADAAARVAAKEEAFSACIVNKR